MSIFKNELEAEIRIKEEILEGLISKRKIAESLFNAYNIEIDDLTQRIERLKEEVNNEQRI